MLVQSAVQVKSGISMSRMPGARHFTMVTMKLIPVSENVFDVETSNSFGLVGEQVVFELNPDGTVYRMRSGSNYSYPVKDWN